MKDRPTQVHEHLFLLSKSERYYFDHSAIQEKGANGHMRNSRSVWSINTEPFEGAHFAVFPGDLVRRCVLASSRPSALILDPFFGSGTVGEVCQILNRGFLGIELNPDYVEIARKRLKW